MGPVVSGDLARILREASVLRGPARDAYLDSSCAGNADLRGRALRALELHDSATIPGDESAGGDGVDPAATREAMSEEAHPALGKRVGAYTIVGVLGEGGMGTVFLAEQPNPSRLVALKVLRAGLLSRRMLKRFEHESQVLGRLQHPGIAQIFEASTATFDGAVRPFFAMELVRGLPITEHAAGQALDQRERLGLFARVASAVHHAHQKGVIHRDLKPGNILVDQRGDPKVLDFGVARETDAVTGGATLQTEAGQIVGTIPYMSPEQISGDPAEVDIRSDVYSLGVVLYELLCGRLPHAVHGRTIADAARIITHEPPAPLAGLDRSLGGDVQWVVWRALEKEKARRYQSAAEFGADVERLLRGEAVTAHPPSRTYLVRSIARRHRELVSAVVAVFLVLAAATGLSAWQAVRAVRAQRVAQIEADNANAVNEFLNSMLASADPDNALGRDVSLKELLDASARDVGASFVGRPRVEASIRGTLASTYSKLGRFGEAEAQSRAALDLCRERFGADAAATIEATRGLANVLADASKPDLAEAMTRDALGRLARTEGTDCGAYALAQGELARELEMVGKYGEAIELFERWIPVARAKFGAQHREVMSMAHNLAITYKDDGQFEKSTANFLEQIDTCTRLYGAEHPQTLTELNNLGACKQKEGLDEEAAGIFRRVMETRSRVMGPEHPATLISAANLAVALTSMKRLGEAEPLVRSSLAAWEKLVGEEHSKTLICRANLAYLLEDQGKLDEAEAIYRRTIEICKKSRGRNDPETWAPMNNLAYLLQRGGKLDEAEAMYRELLTACEGSLPPGHYFVAIFRNNYGECLTRMGRFDQAAEALTTSLVVLEKTFPPEHPRIAKGKARLAQLDETRRAAGTASRGK